MTQHMPHLHVFSRLSVQKPLIQLNQTHRRYISNRTNKHPVYDVLIAGGGIFGASLASALGNFYHITSIRKSII
jgi:hypothetical protein